MFKGSSLSEPWLVVVSSFAIDRRERSRGLAKTLMSLEAVKEDINEPDLSDVISDILPPMMHTNSGIIGDETSPFTNDHT